MVRIAGCPWSRVALATATFVGVIAPGCTWDWDHRRAELTFQRFVSPDPAYDGTSDTFIRAQEPTLNFSQRTEVEGTDDSLSLLQWDVSAVPQGSVVEAVCLSLFVINDSPEPYQVRALLRSWVAEEATWEVAALGEPWNGDATGSFGPANYGEARLGTVLPNGIDVFRTTCFEPAGVAVVQGWVDDPSQNFGIAILDPEENNGNGFDARSSDYGEDTTAHPALTITYVAPSE